MHDVFPEMIVDMVRRRAWIASQRMTRAIGLLLFVCILLFMSFVCLLQCTTRHFRTEFVRCAVAVGSWGPCVPRAVTATRSRVQVRATIDYDGTGASVVDVAGSVAQSCVPSVPLSARDGGGVEGDGGTLG